MITALRIQNFKCFADTRLRFGSLTLLAGANATGKSTTIQTLLLLRQSHLRRTFDTGNLLLSGALTNVGTAGDVINQTVDSDEIAIELSAEGRPDRRFAFTYRTADKSSYTLQTEGVDPFPYNPIVYDPNINLFETQFNYLNAERIGPRLMYPMFDLQGDSINVGVHGEYAAHVLARYQDSLIACESLAHRNEAAGELSLKVEPQTRYWMRTFIPNFEIKVEELTSADQVRVMLGTGTRELVRPTNIGFGIIYTLPIVVGALVAPAGSLLIVENPEAHLHPASQSQIGMFLARAAAAGIQVVIETHSDHVLNGIRRAVRHGVLQPEHVSILFFAGEGRVETPEIYRDGGIDPWPHGFFDQMEKDLRELF
ncbi:MAG: DUF3696 domain-containing protein [Chlorobiaceae bacterium]